MSTLNGRGLRTVAAKTAAYTVTAADNGTTFTNAGASGAVTFTLPPATVGLWYRFVVKAAQELRIDPSGTETISLATGVQQAAGKYITADAAGERISVECVAAGVWETAEAVGTWGVEG
ncbi:MAG: hypothetical protein KBA95_12040 [Acidobacteria bacterium]|nr:hypothetical protein [Acidobacteriota bacterium]